MVVMWKSRKPAKKSDWRPSKETCGEGARPAALQPAKGFACSTGQTPCAGGSAPSWLRSPTALPAGMKRSVVYDLLTKGKQKGPRVLVERGTRALAVRDLPLAACSAAPRPALARGAVGVRQLWPPACEPSPDPCPLLGLWVALPLCSCCVR